MNENTPQPRKSWVRRHKAISALGATAVLVIAIGAAAASSHPTTTQTPTTSPSTSTSMTEQKCVSEGYTWDGSTCTAYQVVDPNGASCSSADSQGYCPGDDPTPSDPPSTVAQADTVTYIVTGSDADVTYGPAGSDHTGYSGMKKTETIPDSPPAYYAITAQLQGGGSVSCKIEVNGQVISSSSADGGYNIAQCEIGQDFDGNWQNDN